MLRQLFAEALELRILLSGSIRGFVFNDRNGNGVQDTGEFGVSGRTIYIDLDKDSTLDANETRTMSDPLGTYMFTSLPAGTYKIRQVLSFGAKQTFPSNNFGHTVTLSPDQTVTGEDFGTVTPRLASISGTLFRDTNGNGVKNSGEPAIGGRTVWLDLDNDKVVDDNEPITTTDQTGHYALSAPAGTYKVREVIPAGWEQTLPSNGFGINVTVLNGQNSTGHNFGSRPIVGTASITGRVFHDFNRNGVRDSGDSFISAWRVYIDTNNNGVLDAGEISVVTGSNGKYEFSNLAAATYKVREVLQSGFVQTTPANNFGINVTLSSGQSATGKSFGVDN